MKSLMILACAILMCSCGGAAQTNPTLNSSPGQAAASSATPKVATIPIPDDIGPVLQCAKCVFYDEKGLRYIAGEVHNDAKQTLYGYALALDLQDAKGQSVKKIPGLMLMNAMTLQPGETKEFKERVLSTEANVTQASVYFKKAGKDVKLSDTFTLKLNAPVATPTPTPRKKIVPPKP